MVVAAAVVAAAAAEASDKLLARFLFNLSLCVLRVLCGEPAFLVFTAEVAETQNEAEGIL